MSSMPVPELSTGARLVRLLLRVHLTKTNRLFFPLLLHPPLYILGMAELFCCVRGGVCVGVGGMGGEDMSWKKNEEGPRQQTDGLEKSDVSTEGTKTE